MDDFLEKNFKKTNIYKPGTAEYYKDVIDMLRIIAVDYDGYDTKNPKSMRRLLKDLKNIARKGLDHEKMYWRFIQDEE